MSVMRDALVLISLDTAEFSSAARGEYNTALYCTVLYFILLYFTMMMYIAQYCTLPCFIYSFILHCIVL